MLRQLAVFDPLVTMERVTLAHFKEDQERLLPHLQARLKQETDEPIIACLLLCLGRLLPAAADSSALLMPYLTTGDMPLIRLCAVLALSFLLEGAVPEEVMLVFFIALTDPASVQAVYDEL